MPDTLTPQELSAIRERDARPGEWADAQAADDRHALLTHNAGLTEAVRRIPGMGPGMDYISRAAVLAILGEPYDD